MLQRTTDMWTTGIFNVPIDNPQSRYLFFEIDNKNAETFNKVIDTYLYANLDVYWHETGNGYHFISLVAIAKEEHHRLVKTLKYLNPMCPLTTLRIIANKYYNERGIWLNDGIQGCDFRLTNYKIVDLQVFRQWLRHQYIGLIKKNYNTTRYPFPERKLLA